MEKERVINLLGNLYNGHPWIDVTIMSTFRGITAQQAASKVIPNCNSIWEIVNHMIGWRENVLQRLKGKILTTPTNNYIKPIENTSQEAWLKTLGEFEQTQKEWISFLKTFNIENFGTEYPPNGMTYYDHIHGIIQHDAYHLGQIILLSKLSES